MKEQNVNRELSSYRKTDKGTERERKGSKQYQHTEIHFL